MIINWLLRTIILMIILALILHFQVKLPFYFSWIGHLPGDMLLKDVSREIDFPVSSAVLISSFISLILPSRK